MKHWILAALTFSTSTAFALENVKCHVVDFPNLGTRHPTVFVVDVDTNIVDTKLATFQGEEKFELSVNIVKRQWDGKYILDASIVKANERTIHARAMGEKLPLTLQLGNMNDKTQEVSWLTMTCGL